MSFTDQKPRKATEKQVTGWGGVRQAGRRFRCYLCGYKFKIGDYWRWVNASQERCTNFLVCKECDGEDVVDRWVVANEEAKKRFWWFTMEEE